MSYTTEIERCDCDTCLDREKPCAFDCDVESECDGCKVARIEQRDLEYHIDLARGLF